MLAKESSRVLQSTLVQTDDFLVSFRLVGLVEREQTEQTQQLLGLKPTWVARHVNTTVSGLVWRAEALTDLQSESRSVKTLSMKSPSVSGWKVVGRMT